MSWLLDSRIGRQLARCRAAAVFVLLGLLGWGGYVAGWELWARRHHRLAQQELARYHWANARSHLILCLEVWPHCAETNLLLARTSRRLAAYNDAEKYLRRSEQFHGDRDAIVLERTLASAQRGDLDGTETRLVSLVNQDHPDTSVILEALSQGYLATHRLPDALRSLERLLQAEPEHVQALLWRARAWEGLLYMHEAREDLRQVVRLAPDNREARLLLAESLLDNGQAQDAQEHFEHVQALQPGDLRIALGLARCRRALGQLEEARQGLDAVLAAQPRNRRALAERGRLALAQSLPAEAENWLRQALAFLPYEHGTNYAYYQCLQAQGRQTEAEQCWRKIQRLEADEKRLLELTQEMVVQESRDPVLRYEAARLCLRLGHEEEAVRWLRSAVHEDPGHQPSHLALAEHYTRTGKSDLAEHHRRLGQAKE